jgi:hypothetical protein
MTPKSCMCTKAQILLVCAVLSVLSQNNFRILLIAMNRFLKATGNCMKKFIKIVNPSRFVTILATELAALGNSFAMALVAFGKIGRISKCFAKRFSPCLLHIEVLLLKEDLHFLSLTRGFFHSQLKHNSLILELTLLHMF